MTDLRDILHTPYRLGGRLVGIELDCLGVVGEVARRRGLPPPDGWPSIRRDWEQGRIETASGFPAGWVRQPMPCALQDGDVLVFVVGHRPGCAIVHDGWVVTAEPGRGVYRTDLSRWNIAPAEVWRWSA